jgi:hypothetical protein
VAIINTLIILPLLNAHEYNKLISVTFINVTCVHRCRFDIIWCIKFYFPDSRLSTRKQNTRGVILQIPSYTRGVILQIPSYTRGVFLQIPSYTRGVILQIPSYTRGVILQIPSSLCPTSYYKDRQNQPQGSNKVDIEKTRLKWTAQLDGLKLS